MIGTAYNTVNLQATLSAGNPPGDPPPLPHHPLTCASTLWLDEDGRMGCDHVQVPADDRRTRGAIDQSIAILLIELLREKEDGDGPG